MTYDSVQPEPDFFQHCCTELLFDRTELSQPFGSVNQRRQQRKHLLRLLLAHRPGAARCKQQHNRTARKVGGCCCRRAAADRRIQAAVRKGMHDMSMRQLHCQKHLSCAIGILTMADRHPKLSSQLLVLLMFGMLPLLTCLLHS
jgi:hypothetical protein